MTAADKRDSMMNADNHFPFQAVIIGYPLFHFTPLPSMDGITSVYMCKYIEGSDLFLRYHRTTGENFLSLPRGSAPNGLCRWSAPTTTSLFTTVQAILPTRTIYSTKCYLYEI